MEGSYTGRVGERYKTEGVEESGTCLYKHPQRPEEMRIVGTVHFFHCILMRDVHLQSRFVIHFLVHRLHSSVHTVRHLHSEEKRLPEVRPSAQGLL